MSSHSLSTRRWCQQTKAQEKRALSLGSSTFHLREGESDHEHKRTSMGEDDLLTLLGMPEDTQSWTRFDKRAKTYRTTSSSGPLCENVIARITIDDNTGHIMSLGNTKHINERFVPVTTLCSSHSHVASSKLNCDTESVIETVFPNVRCADC